MYLLSFRDVSRLLEMGYHRERRCTHSLKIMLHSISGFIAPSLVPSLGSLTEVPDPSGAVASAVMLFWLVTD
jgi:hypothetical protein